VLALHEGLGIDYVVGVIYAIGAPTLEFIGSGDGGWPYWRITAYDCSLGSECGVVIDGGGFWDHTFEQVRVYADISEPSTATLILFGMLLPVALYLRRHLKVSPR